MALRHKLTALALGVGALVASTVAASAAPAYATTNVNVRSGPGTSYGVVDALRRGERVDVQYCQGSWCFVEKSGPNGWVSSNYLDRGGPGVRPPVIRPPVVVQPPVYRPGPRPPHWGGPGPRPPHWNRPGPRPPHWGGPGWGNQRPGGSFCFNGPNGYACFGS